MDDLLHQGITAYRAGKQDEARNVFIAVAKQSPDDELAWGWMYQVSVDDKERFYCLKQMLRINPKNEKAKQMLDTLAGQDLPLEPAQKNNVTPVAQTANTQKQSDADLHALDANHWYIEGKQLCDLEDYEEAIRCFENALQLEPQYAYAWHEKALCEDNLGLTFDAIHSYEQVLEFADDEPGLIQSAVARLAELEKDQKPIVNPSKNTESQNPQKDRGITDQPTGGLYHPGDIIGQEYEVLKVLGSGGFGVVYLVFSHVTKSECALKTFQDKFLADAKTRDLFRKEANVLVELERHPYLVQTYFVDVFSGRLFIAMEYIAPNKQGINSLAGYLQYRSPELVQSLRWAIQVCFGMEYAYSKGIRTHRDLKPENIMIAQDGTAKITDFGLAGVLDSYAENSASMKDEINVFGKTQRGDVFGTLTHMPPEQFDDAASCDVRSDIYAFGIVLFQMASGGELPFLATPPRDGSREEIMRFGLDMRRLHNEAPVPRLDSPIYPIIRRCLKKELDKRYQSFVQLRSDLESILKQLNGEIIRVPQLAKQNAQELSYKGLNLNHLGRYEEALHYLDQALELDPRHVGALSIKGSCLNHLGRYEEAISYCDEALAIQPLLAATWNNKGNSLNQLGNKEEAIRCFDKALDIAPRFIDPLINKGNYFNSLRRYEDALDCFNQASELDPRDIDIWLGKGRSLNGLGRYEEAIQYCDKALEIDPRDALVWDDRGRYFSSLGRYEDAIHCCDQALEIDPSNANTWNNKGCCFNSLGEYEEALCYFDKALEIDPRNVATMNNKGFSLANLDRYEEAIQYFDKALEIDPRDLAALGNKGSFHHHLGRYEEAMHYYDKALEIDPRNVNAWNNKGKSFNSLSRYEDAIRCFEKALEIDPHFVDTLNNKADILRNLSRYEEAIQYCDKALEIDPHNASALHNKGNCLISLGRYKEDLRKLEQSLIINGNRENLSGMAEILFNMATIYAQQDELFIALPLAQQSTQLWGQIDHPMKKKAQEFVARIKESRTIYIDEIIENVQKVNSPAELQNVVKKYPIMMDIKFLDEFCGSVLKEIPLDARPAYKQRLEWLAQVVNNISQSAHEVFFYQIDSLAKLHIAVRQYPFMTNDRFIEVVEQVINEQIPLQNKPSFNQLLSWLKEIASQ